MSGFSPSERVIFLGEDAMRMHQDAPKFYPKVGTVGVVVAHTGTPFDGLLEDDDAACVVQWPEGATSAPGMWLAFDRDLAFYSDGEVPA